MKKWNLYFGFLFSILFSLLLSLGCSSVTPTSGGTLGIATKVTDMSISWPMVPQNSAAIVLPSDQIQAVVASAPIAIAKIKIPKPNDYKDNEEDQDSSVPLIFDIPVSYNTQVQYWIHFYQTNGRSSYTTWLERSSRYLPLLKRTLKNEGLPQDLAYLSMIESGFSAKASSSANAVGPWQFIRETGTRYGLKISWWLDERRDFQKSTIAAAKYLKKMYGMFDNWYLVAAGYNTGEARIARMIHKHQTHNFWKIAQKDLQDETKDYVPKFIAALLIAKSPEMYGFRNINYTEPLLFEHFRVPGGTKLADIADAVGVTHKYMEELNPELTHGYIPDNVDSHLIRIPKGSLQLVSFFIRKNFVSSR